MEPNKFFPEIKGNFGFGFMRLPMKGEAIDIEQARRMTDAFMEAGFNYFDTAHGYLSGQSEPALRECLVSRYPRDSFVLTTKLSGFLFKEESEIAPMFARQLANCGTDHFDFYLMHAQDAAVFQKFKRCHAYEFALAMKEGGKVRHFGISFHDKAAVLEQILTEYPQIEVVQIQFNYVDYEDPAVESRKVYEVCEKFGKPVIVMEPVKGGSLVRLPEKAQKILDALDGPYSNANYAIRFAASYPNVCMVLSGMSDMAQMEDNLRAMKTFQPLSEREREAICAVRDVFREMHLIPCTACRYCTDGCPQKIRIPDLFSCMNQHTAFHSWNQKYYYNSVLTRGGGKASDCVGCGQCESVCPQHLPIIKLLRDVAETFER